jgi:hypothetical protein
MSSNPLLAPDSRCRHQLKSNVASRAHRLPVAASCSTGQGGREVKMTCVGQESPFTRKTSVTTSSRKPRQHQHEGVRRLRKQMVHGETSLSERRQR